MRGLEISEMKIFVSYQFSDLSFYQAMEPELQSSGLQVYPKQLKNFLGSSGLHDPDELDEHLRDEDLAIIVLSKNYMTDTWMQGELHALLTLENKLRPNFALPVFLDGIEDKDIPEECIKKPHVDFRGTSLEKGFTELIKLINNYAIKTRLPVVISHNSKDVKIAEALSHLVKSALNLAPEEILCTRGRPRSAEYLRRKIREAKVFVCIATENSIETTDGPDSFDFAVELGARWGMKRYATVMLAAGATESLIKPPFNEFNVLSCEDSGQIYQFIKEIAQRLGLHAQSADKYSGAVDQLIEASKVAGELKLNTRRSLEGFHLGSGMGEAERQDSVGNTTYNLHGPHPRVNIYSQDKSVNISKQVTENVFADIQQAIQTNIQNDHERDEILKKLEDLESAKGTREFTGFYREFMSLAADHLGVLTPFLPALAQMLGG